MPQSQQTQASYRCLVGDTRRFSFRASCTLLPCCSHSVGQQRSLSELQQTRCKAYCSTHLVEQAVADTAGKVFGFSEEALVNQGRQEAQRLLRLSCHHSAGEVLGSEEAPGAEEETDEHDRETLHRLCPTYAKDINSPLRHVRTRIYFTSESHVHSLINVLRFCHLGE